MYSIVYYKNRFGRSTVFNSEKSDDLEALLKWGYYSYETGSNGFKIVNIDTGDIFALSKSKDVQTIYYLSTVVSKRVKMLLRSLLNSKLKVNPSICTPLEIEEGKTYNLLKSGSDIIELSTKDDFIVLNEIIELVKEEAESEISSISMLNFDCLSSGGQIPYFYSNVSGICLGLQ